jgi:hypothetical protein
LTELADFIADSVLRLQKRLIRDEEVWQLLRPALQEKFNVLAATLSILPPFGEDCDAELAKLLPRARTLSAALALDVGDTVEVAYDKELWKGLVTGVEDALRAEGAAVLVRYSDDEAPYIVDPAEGEIRLVAAGPRPAARVSGVSPRAPPFHLALACVGGSAEEALRELELQVRTLADLLKHLPAWSTQGARPGQALRKLVDEVANRAAEARGWLTGVWPTAARLSRGQVGEGLPKLRRGAVAAQVLRVETRAGRGERAELRFGGAAGAWKEWVDQAEWAGRFRVAGSAWPGSGELDARDDSDGAGPDGRGGAAAKRQRRA